MSRNKQSAMDVDADGDEGDWSDEEVPEGIVKRRTIAVAVAILTSLETS